MVAAPGDADRLVAQLPRAVGGDERYEFSIKLAPGRLRRGGRFTAWLETDDPATTSAAAVWLDRMRAPDPVRRAWATLARPVRLGFGAAVDGQVVEHRLYLHDVDAETGRYLYRAWRWCDGAEARACGYAFHFMPETPIGETPAALAGAWARRAVAALTDEPLVRGLSGFWLRRDGAGTIDQVDLALPWAPRAGTLPGMAALLDRFGLTPADRHWVERLPVRHVAFPTTDEETLTLYVSAPLVAAPRDERALRDDVIAAADGGRADMAAALARFTLPAIAAGRGPIDHFYSSLIDRWRAVLGPAMHYHNALFDAPVADPDDAAMEAASRRAVTELHPFIAPGASVYDVGCGWGGPLAMLARERGCRALGVTVAREQFRHVAGKGLPVRWADAEATLPPGRFDVALLLESFEHIVDKPRLLRVLRAFAGRLVMRVNCQDAAPPSRNFGGTMAMTSSASLRALLADAGWRVIHWRDRRGEAVPSVAAWRRRLAALPVGDDAHLEVFRGWCDRVHALGAAWADNNPLIEVVAE